MRGLILKRKDSIRWPKWVEKNLKKIVLLVPNPKNSQNSLFFENQFMMSYGIKWYFYNIKRSKYWRLEYEG